MDRASARRRQDTQTTVGASIQAPVNGWNARDPIAAQKPGDAYQLDNWVPRPGYVEIRRGFVAHVVGFEEVPESLLVYRDGANEEQFAASGAGLYDVTASGGLPTPVVTGFGSARFQYLNFANDAGHFLIAVNGEDTPIKYDGASWGTTVITGTSGSIVLDPDTLIDVMVHKRRLFFHERDSLRIWYLGVDDIAGTAGLLDLGPVFPLGGNIVGMGVWSPYGGLQTAEAIACFVTDQGEVAIYAGNDPGDADDWALQGVYQIGKPLGRRALLKTASDLAIITYDGALPLSVIKNAKRENQKSQSVTSRIQDAFALASNAYGHNFGWEAMIYPSGQLAIINVPVTELGVSRQFVQNTQTGAWCQFIGINAVCWAYASSNAFFAGTDGAGNIGVFRWDTGSSDNGTAIQCDLVTAFQDFGSPGRLKNFTEMRPILRASSLAMPYVDMLTDYRITEPTNIPDSGSVGVEGLWGSGLWGTALWTTGQPLSLNWTAASGVGRVGAARIRITTNPDASSPGPSLWDHALWDESEWDADTASVYPTISASLIGFDIMFTPGGVL